MSGKRRNLLAAGVLALIVGLVAGCNGSTVGDQARSSLSSFLTGIVNNAITDVVNGNN